MNCIDLASRRIIYEPCPKGFKLDKGAIRYWRQKGFSYDQIAKYYRAQLSSVKAAAKSHEKIRVQSEDELQKIIEAVGAPRWDKKRTI